MAKQTGSRKPRIIIFSSITLLFLFCLVIFINSHSNIISRGRLANQATIDDRAARGGDIWNKHMVDTAVGLLQTGDLVLRDGIDMTSDLLRQMNQTDKTYSHCGLVVVEHGYPFVYHAIGGEDNPDARLRRDSACFFFSPYNNLRFGIARFDITDSAKYRMAQILRAYHRQRVRFDMNFDLKTDDKLYCAELVYKTINKATQDSLYIVPTRVMGYTFVGTDNLFINPHTTMIWQVRFK